jgi:hypothetical protein
MKKFYFLMGFWVAFFSVKAQNVATFDDVFLSPNSYWNGSDSSDGISSGGFYFPNNYNASWGSWSGFAVSNMKDSTTTGWGNQYSAITASGAKNSENYAVGYPFGNLSIQFENPILLSGFYVTNSTYAYLSMCDGDSYAKKFGGENGTDPDYFKLIISGTDIFGNLKSVEFYLADFTFEDATEDYIIKNWEWIDLSSLGVVTGVSFGFESSDMSFGYINTPTYFCIDDFNGISPNTPVLIAEAGMENLELEAESFYNGADGEGSFNSGGFTFLNSFFPSPWGDYWSGFAASNVTDNQTAGWTNQYSAISGKGALGTSAYAVSYGNSEIQFSKTTVSGLYITNATYTYFSMLNGDDYSKKFGGEDGFDPDWFKVSVAGISETGDTTGIINYFLADFTGENNYIVNDWRWLDLSSLGEITKLRFSLSSSDVGAWGMNTPAYFCIDQLNHQDLAPVIVNPVATVEEPTYPSHVYYVSLDSVFTDPDNDDSEMVIRLEYIDNPDLLMGTIVEGGKPGELETLLSLNISERKTGSANITISATSNGKTVYHTFKMVVSVPVSSGLIAKKELKVYPNPVQSEFYVELPVNAEQIILYSLSGKIIYSEMVSGETKISISQLQYSPTGIYFLKVKIKEEFVTQKIVKL